MDRVLRLLFATCLLGQYSFAILTNRTDDFVDVFLAHSDWDSHSISKTADKCTIRLHSSLEKLRKRQAHLKTSALIDLSGYALHQPLRNAPYDMYVTDIRVRAPPVGHWARVQKCHFTHEDNRVITKILFNDLTVSGVIRLYEENDVLKNPTSPTPTDFCNMTLRLKKAGLGINAIPTRARSGGIQIRTLSRFVDPNFISIHAYGCKLNQLFKETPEKKGLRRRMGRGFEIITIGDEDRIEPRIERTETDTSTDKEPQVRIISLSSDEMNLGDSDTEVHKQRLTRVKPLTEREKLAGVLQVQEAIAQQANALFQAHGPFSQTHNEFTQAPKPSFNGLFSQTKPIGTITELDDKLTPVRPTNKPFAPLHQFNDKIVYYGPPNFQSKYDDVSKEMEEVFLRGIKTLLTKYLEKQLELPLKEALMSNIGYTVSYG